MFRCTCSSHGRTSRWPLRVWAWHRSFWLILNVSHLTEASHVATGRMAGRLRHVASSELAHPPSGPMLGPNVKTTKKMNDVKAVIVDYAYVVVSERSVFVPSFAHVRQGLPNTKVLLRCGVGLRDVRCPKGRAMERCHGGAMPLHTTLCKNSICMPGNNC